MRFRFNRMSFLATAHGITPRTLMLTLVSLIAFAMLVDRTPAETLRWLLPVIAAVSIAYSIWKRPAFAAFILMAAALTVGDIVILVAAPAVILLARRDLRRNLERPRSMRAAMFTAISALVALVIALLYADLSFGPWAPDAQSSSAASPAQAPFGGATGSGGQNAVERFLRWIGIGDEPGGSRPVAVARPDEDDSSFPWWIIAALVCFALAGLLAWHAWRRWRSRPHGDSVPTAADALARLEAIGAALGRPRRRHEGAIGYASALEDHTGDLRLEAAGHLVSAEVYRSAAIDPATVDTTLDGLEATPPPRPPEPTLADRARGRMSMPSGRTIAVGLAAMALLAGAGWKLAPHLGNLSVESDALADQGPVEPPDAYRDLLAAAPEQVAGWQMCGSTDGAYRSSESAWGLWHRSEDLALVEWSVGPDRSRLALVGTAVHDGGDEYTRYDAGHWFRSYSRQVPMGPFESVDAVLEGLHVGDPLRSEGVDRFGRRFVRFESPPVRYTDAYGYFDADPSPRLGEPSTEQVWAVDVWVGVDGRPDRVRVQLAEPTESWYEWRRVTIYASGQSIQPDCPETMRPGGASVWAGRDDWLPTLAPPVQIALDPEGHPYDTESWQGPATFPPPVDEVGAFGTALDQLHFGNVYDMITATRIATPQLAIDVEWATGARLSAIESDGFAIAIRVDTADRGRAGAASWTVTGRIDPLDESPVAIAADGAVAEGGLEDIAAIVDRTWTGERFIGFDVDGDDHDDLAVVDAGGGTTVVAGRDAGGEVVSVVVWAEWYPWRTLGLEGDPPYHVVQREAELRACLDGSRPIDGAGRCT